MGVRRTVICICGCGCAWSTPVGKYTNGNGYRQSGCGGLGEVWWWYCSVGSCLVLRGLQFDCGSTVDFYIEGVVRSGDIMLRLV